MTPKTLADLHARAMPPTRVWTAKAFADLLATPGIFLTVHPSSLSKYANGGARGSATPSQTATAEQAQNLFGFALGRVTLDEAELLTIAVDPRHQGKGIGRQCLDAFEAQATQNGASRAFLEVAADNNNARALYHTSGWIKDGTRPNYYSGATGREDAILMSKPLFQT